MNHIAVSRTQSDLPDHSRATQNDELLSAFRGVATGITRPYSVRRPIDAAIQGRSVRPLGVYPRISEECAKQGGSWYHVTRPLFVQLARLRALFNGPPLPLKDALVAAQKEESEAGVCELSLALDVQCPSASVLESYIRETREEIEAETRAVEVAESMLYARGVK